MLPSQSRLNLVGRIYRKRWGDEVVVYDDASSHTHLINHEADEILAALEEAAGSCTFEDLRARLVRKLDVASPEIADFDRWLEEHLREYSDCDLIEIRTPS